MPPIKNPANIILKAPRPEMEPSDTYRVPGLSGHWHRSLRLPVGYMHYDWYVDGPNPNGVYLNALGSFLEVMRKAVGDLYLNCHHEVPYDNGIIKNTRSSPNIEGGLVTYATCRHHLRTTLRRWEGTWLAGLGPKECSDNTLFFVGRVSEVFRSNYALGVALARRYPAAYEVKLASTNPRGDIYSPIGKLVGDSVYDHNNFYEPPNHTRSVEFYDKSLGSTSPDGKIPKWWRDHEYISRTRVRPPSFILSPCFLFSRPTLWTSHKPRRAVMKMTPAQFLESIRSEP